MFVCTLDLSLISSSSRGMARGERKAKGPAFFSFFFVAAHFPGNDCDGLMEGILDNNILSVKHANSKCMDSYIRVVGGMIVLLLSLGISQFPFFQSKCLFRPKPGGRAKAHIHIDFDATIGALIVIRTPCYWPLAISEPYRRGTGRDAGSRDSVLGLYVLVNCIQ